MPTHTGTDRTRGDDGHLDISTAESGDLFGHPFDDLQVEFVVVNGHHTRTDLEHHPFHVGEQILPVGCQSFSSGRHNPRSRRGRTVTPRLAR